MESGFLYIYKINNLTSGMVELLKKRKN